ncbi:MAG TPA: aspartate aminotransferase family protein [Actinomycetota bacterium]|nr:aspartate aminotransferase family protein [Actinomycetota bacterium]
MRVAKPTPIASAGWRAKVMVEAANTPTDEPPVDGRPSIERSARRHLWQHFNKPLADDTPTPVIMERGEGCYLWDTSGKRYLDGMAGLYAVQAGHGRAELAEAAAGQARKLGFYPIWTSLHPPAAQLAERIAGLAPGALNLVFFTTGGGEAVESAWKLAHQYFSITGQPQRTKVIARDMGYHGTTLGALAVSGLDSLKEPFSPLLSDLTSHAAATNRTQCRFCAGQAACSLACADDIEQKILAEGPETVAAVFLEPVQVRGGCLTPADGYFARVSEICDRYGVLLVSEEAICAFGRLGDWFGCARLGYQPDMITFAMGATSGYAPLGGVIVSDRIGEAFRHGEMPFSHGLTFAGHPVACAVALANIDLLEREGLNDRVRSMEPEFRGRLETLLEHPLVTEVRGMGYFYALALGRESGPLSSEEQEWLGQSFFNRRLPELGLICRVDELGGPALGLSPPLIAGPPEFERIVAVLRQGLDEAWHHLDTGNLQLDDPVTRRFPAATA